MTNKYLAAPPQGNSFAGDITCAFTVKAQAKDIPAVFPRIANIVHHLFHEKYAQPPDFALRQGGGDIGFS